MELLEFDATETATSWQRRTLRYAVGLGAIMLAYAVVYHFGMAYVENRPRTFLHSLQVVVETFTTTGFGSDAPWTTPWMNAFVIVMDLTGVALIFLALPLLLFPLFEEAVTTTAPTEPAEPLSDHVVICSLSPRTDALVTELDSRDVDYVLVEADEDRAADLHEDDYSVIHGDPERVAGLEAAGLADARVLVADVDDRTNTSIVLTAREVGGDVQVVSVVEHPDRRQYHELAGADVVLTPRELLGESLAAKVTTFVATDLGDAVEIGDGFELAELPVHRESDLVGRTIAESRIRERTGANVLGAWLDGRFESPPEPDTEIGASTVLLAAGSDDQLQRLRDRTRSVLRRPTAGETIVIGYGETGHAVTDVLSRRNVSHTVVDIADAPGVDVVGDATEPETLVEAGVENADTVVLALPDDALMEVVTLVIRDLNSSVEVVARAGETENVRKIYRAGADYVLSLATVSGRMLATTILEDEEVLSLDTQIEVVRTPAAGLAGQRLGEARVRSRTGCTVLAVERDGELVTELGPDFEFEADDSLVVAGTDADTTAFTELLD